MGAISLVAYCDDLNEYEWFSGLDPELRGARFERILPRGKNPPEVENLLRYDRPDVILVSNDKPVLVVEKTREVPTGHNVGQRMARLVRALENKVPAIKFFPFDARKHGKHSGVCNMNARLLFAFEQMWALHETPVMAINWPADEYGELHFGVHADHAMSNLIGAYLESGLDKTCEVFELARATQLIEYRLRCLVYPSYGEPPPSLSIEPTDQAICRMGILPGSANANKLTRLPESAVYTIGMTEAACRREDPYTGTQFIYDYLYCRRGPRVEHKYRNLLLYFPNIRTEVWKRKNPNDPERKSSNWYLTANALIFNDGVIYLR